MSCNQVDTGKPSGACNAVSAGIDPRGNCAAAGGACDGNGKCSCLNGNQDGDETGPDCGGGNCVAKCALTQGCHGDMDCASAHCADTGAGQICCDADCSGPCVVCDRTNFVGKCEPLSVGDVGGCTNAGEGCNTQQMCEVKGLHGANCGMNGDCLSNQCVGMGQKHCSYDDPKDYPCVANNDCHSQMCDPGTHLCK
jgi:hypothetical protein